MNWSVRSVIKIEKTKIYGWEEAIRGMRNPLNSWSMSDTELLHDVLQIGEKDLDLMKRLRNAGTDHRKYMRMITVYVDLTAPLYWWKEFDTYKVGTVANSCSTMHKIHAKEFTLDDFSHEHLCEDGIHLLKNIIEVLNDCREMHQNFEKYLVLGEFDPAITSKKDIWWQMIQLLPTSYNQKRTVMLNYEVLANIYKSRKNHKLDEWHDFCAWIESLPHADLITGGES